MNIAPGIYYGSPALSADQSTLYVGTSQGILAPPADGHSLRALSVATGAQRWTVPLGDAEVRSSPAVGPDGSITVLVETRSGATTLPELLRVSSSGVLLWRRALGAAPAAVDIGCSAPAIGSDGAAFVAADSLYAYNSDGSRRWARLYSGEQLRASPTLGADGTVYFASHNLPLTAFDPVTGDERWSVALGINDHVMAPPSIGADGSIYVAALGCRLWRVSSAGVVQWEYDVSAGGNSCSLKSSPAIASDGTLYLGTTSHEPVPVLVAVNADGTRRWTFTPPAVAGVPGSHLDIYSSPALGSDGAVYFGQEFGRVYALDAATGSQRWMVSTGAAGGITWSSPALTGDGVLLINTLNGGVMALTTESAGLATTAPWPRYRGGNASAGRR